jgi:lactate dehydrogenase-like 2-hydroxyacid dehydrogenase
LLYCHVADPDSLEPRRTSPHPPLLRAPGPRERADEADIRQIKHSRSNRSSKRENGTGGRALAVLASVAGKQRHRSVSAPAPQTQGLLNAERLGLMVAGAAFINVSRGSIVDEPALIDALRSGYSGEATLDVFATEPLPASSPLWEMDNVPSPRILPRSRRRRRQRRRLARICGDCGLASPC